MSRIKIAIGVKRTKKIIPSTIGLTIMPSKIPKRIHSLFRGRRASLFTSVTSRNVIAAALNTYAQVTLSE